MKNPLARFVGLSPSPQGILITLRLGPKTTKEQIETWLGEEGALVGLIHAPEKAQMQSSAQPQDQKGGAKAQWLGARCKEPLFQQFILECGLIGHIDGNKQLAETNVVKAVKAVCGVKSRAEIDHDDIAGQAFTKKIMHPYAEFVKKKGRT